MYYTIYKVTNNINGKFYIGKHQTKNLQDNYLGSGIAIKQAIRKYGRKNFTKEILYIFNTENEMNLKEKEIVLLSEQSYNLTLGGRGGWEYIQRHGLNHGSNNVMHSEDNKKRNIESRRKTFQADPEKYQRFISSSKNNILKAIDYNIGKKKPKHSKFMSKENKIRWQNRDYKEKIRNSNSFEYEVISPVGVIYKTNRLQEFCIENKLKYISVWKTTKTGNPVKKGASKGWKAKIIAR